MDRLITKIKNVDQANCLWKLGNAMVLESQENTNAAMQCVTLHTKNYHIVDSTDC